MTNLVYYERTNANRGDLISIADAMLSLEEGPANEAGKSGGRKVRTGREIEARSTLVPTRS